MLSHFSFKFSRSWSPENPVSKRKPLLKSIMSCYFSPGDWDHFYIPSSFLETIILWDNSLPDSLYGKTFAQSTAVAYLYSTVFVEPFSVKYFFTRITIVKKRDLRLPQTSVFLSWRSLFLPGYNTTLKRLYSRLITWGKIPTYHILLTEIPPPLWDCSTWSISFLG